MKRAKLTFAILSLLSATSLGTAQSQLYRMRQMRAAPGELLNVIELLKGDIALAGAVRVNQLKAFERLYMIS